MKSRDTYKKRRKEGMQILQSGSGVTNDSNEYFDTRVITNLLEKGEYVSNLDDNMTV